MKEKSYIKAMGIFKLVQLVFTICIDTAFFLVLFLNEDLRNNIFENKALTFLCTFIWFALLVFLIFIFVDLFYIRRLSIETHELNKRAYLDSLTNIPNRQSLDMLFDSHCSPESIASMGCSMVRISNLDAVNDKAGRKAGDILLQDFCGLINEINNCYDFVGRNSGNEFVFIIEKCDNQIYDNFRHQLATKLNAYNKINPETPIEVEMSFTMNSQVHLKKLNQLFASTSDKLHKQTSYDASMPASKED